MDIVFLLAITAFIIYKLFQTLGREDGNAKQFKHIETVSDCLKNHVNHVKDVEFEIVSVIDGNYSPKVKKVFKELIRVEKLFSVEHFLKGAKKAFRMIVMAFNSNEIETLKELLESNVCEKFIAEINGRIAAQVKHEVTLVGIKEVKIVDAEIEKEIASIKLEIISDQIVISKDKDKNIIAGSTDKILSISDIWTFSKKINSGNLWKLTQTESK